MQRTAKLVMWLIGLLIVTLAACAPVSTPLPPTAINPPPTAVRVPTLTLAPPPTASALRGKYDAGGVDLNLVCVGSGSPTVIFDSGWGVDSSTWRSIIPKLPAETRACTYDRAGLGSSADQSGSRTSGQMVEQLHTLLTNAEVAGPYLLVGHSLGGMNMLVFADRYRAEVAGVVLVDSAHPDQVDRFMAALPTPAPDEDSTLAALRKEIAIDIWANPQEANFPEPMDWAETLAQVRAVKSLGSLPLAVLVAVDSKRSPWSTRPSAIRTELDQVWLDLHKDYTALSTASSLIQAEHSGHFIQQDEPQLVIDAILGLVVKARQK